MRVLREELGQAMSEYVMLIAFIALLVVPGELILMWGIQQMFLHTAQAITQTPHSTPPPLP